MPRYEYKVEPITSASDTQAKLNDLGAEGWRLVAAPTSRLGYDEPRVLLILEREREDDD